MDTPVIWHAANALPPLAEGNVHVWRSSIRTAPKPAAATLDATERDRLNQLRIPTARTRFLAGRFFCRSVLARYLSVEPAAIAFAVDPGGKPRIRAPQTQLEFNLSHSHDLVLLAVGRQALGMDVEHLRAVRDSLRIARRVLPAANIRHLEGVEEPPRSVAFLQFWTQFEARQKALGRGVFADPATELTNGIAFQPDGMHIGCLAWLVRDAAPKVSWFSADILP